MADRAQLAADLGAEPVELEQWRAAGGSEKILVGYRITASYTIDQLRGTLAAA